MRTQCEVTCPKSQQGDWLDLTWWSTVLTPCPNPDIAWGVCGCKENEPTIAKSFRIMQMCAQLDRDEHGKNLESQLP
jgi:hypothetical protein